MAMLMLTLLLLAWGLRQHAAAYGHIRTAADAGNHESSSASHCMEGP